MKTTISVVIGCLSVLMWNPAIADCTFLNDYGTTNGCRSETSCGSDAGEYTSTCQCTDPGCNGSNTCISRSACCEAFGNVGGR